MNRDRFIIKAVSGYLMFGLCWIFLSDSLLSAVSSPEVMAELSMVKGVLFILITGLLMYFALKGIPDVEKNNRRSGDEAWQGFRRIERAPLWAAHGFAVAVSFGMLLLRMKIAVSFGERPMLILFMMPIILSSALGGLGPGLTATFVSTAGIDFFGIPPLRSFKIHAAHDFFQWFILVVSGIMASYLCELLHRARRLADERRILQEQAQARLRQSEERFNLAMMGANDGLWDWNMDTDEVYLSPRWAAMLGYDDHELAHHLDTWKKVVHPDDMQRTLALVNDIVKGKRDRFDAEFRLRHKGGTYLDILSRAFPVRDENGRIVRMVGTHVDVTERRRAEKVLKEREAMLDKTSRMARVGGWGFDVATGHGTWTDEVARIHDLEPSVETDVRTGLSFFHGEHLDAIQAAVRDAIENATPYDLELQLVSAKGRVKWVRTAGYPVTENGKVVRVEGIIQDISDRKQAQLELQALNMDLERRVEQRTHELSAANEELESFAYAVSHDLRAPLRAMSGFSQALVEDYGDRLDGEARVYLDQIVTGSRRMGELIDGLLALSRSTRSMLTLDRVDLSDVSTRILENLARDDKNRNVNWDVEPGLAATGDAAMLDAVMANLLGNAWKYTSRTEDPWIRVHSGFIEGKMAVCVSDNGAGFEENHSKKLFQPFQRLHRQDEFPGIGIGLATVRRIVVRHGGEIRARGWVDQGASFCFRLPEDGCNE